MQTLGDVGNNTPLCQCLQLSHLQVEVVVVNFAHEIVEQVNGRADLCTHIAGILCGSLLRQDFLVLNHPELFQGHFHVLVVFFDSGYSRLLFCCFEEVQGIEDRNLLCVLRYQEEHLAEIGFQEYQCVARQGYAFHGSCLTSRAAAERQLGNAVVLPAVGMIECAQLFVEGNLFVEVLLLLLHSLIEQLAEVAVENLILRINLIVLAKGAVEGLNLADGNLIEVNFPVTFSRRVEYIIVDVLRCRANTVYTTYTLHQTC